MQLFKRWLVALAAAGVVVNPCSAEPIALPKGVEYRSAQRSALVSRRDVHFLVAKWQEGAQSTTILARPQGIAPRVVGRMQSFREGVAWFVSVHKLPTAASAAESADLEMATLEQLYSLVLQQEPQARYCLASGDLPCDPRRSNLSHAQVLRGLADLRQALAARIPRAVPWQVVEMRAASTGSGAEDDDTVGVRVVTAGRPLENVVVYFNRAPHSICSARTGVDGVATCRLQDQHGDGDEHDHAEGVVATFPGDLRPDRVLLPTTHVLSTTGPLTPAEGSAPGDRP